MADLLKILESLAVLALAQNSFFWYGFVDLGNKLWRLQNAAVAMHKEIAEVYGIDLISTYHSSDPPVWKSTRRNNLTERMVTEFLSLFLLGFDDLTINTACDIMTVLSRHVCQDSFTCTKQAVNSDFPPVTMSSFIEDSSVSSTNEMDTVFSTTESTKDVNDNSGKPELGNQPENPSSSSTSTSYTSRLENLESLKVYLIPDNYLSGEATVRDPTRSRRVYDIANTLSTLGLLRKETIGKRDHFHWAFIDIHSIRRGEFSETLEHDSGGVRIQESMQA